MKKYKVISLFSGCGGLDLGFINSGRFEIVLANDHAKAAVNTYRKNIGDHIVEGDIASLVDFPEADVIIGGPPCQGFCSANPNRTLDDPRNWLFKEYVRILGIVKPKMFLMENVKGMKTLGRGEFYKAIRECFAGAGYRLYESVLDASDFGVPQKRHRLFLVGVRKDFEFPFSFHVPAVGNLKTVGDAFHNFPADALNHKVSNLTPLNLKRLNFIPQGGSMADCPESLRNNSNLGRAMRRLSTEHPSHTIVHNNCDHYYHPTENRRITIREMARIQTYPDHFEFTGSKSEQSLQVANSVPPKLAWELAVEMASFLDRTCP